MTVDQATGTVAGLLTFLGEVIDESRVNRATAQAVRSAWRTVVREFEISPDTAVEDLAPDELVDAFETQRRGRFRSGATYRTRLRTGLQWYRCELSGDAGWADTSRRTDGGLNQSTASHGYTLVLQFPLRRGLLIDITVPADLTCDEADRLAGFYRSLVVPHPDAGQRDAPAT